MHPLDYTVILLYFVLVIGLGWWYRRRAAQDLDSYFLGGKQIHWIALAMSGSVSNFDITGTMWIVTLITLFGMKSMWNHWMWGFVMGAFFLAYMGKWIRRSGVMTGAEWMVTRFGPGPAGTTARIAYALMAVVTVAGFLGYAFQGIGKFASVYLGVAPELCATCVFILTAVYVLLGGLFSVVATDVIQTIILTAAGLLIAGIAYAHVSPEALAATLPADFPSLIPPWRLESGQSLTGTGYEGYEFFGALALVWVAKGVLLNLGGPAQMYDFQRFLAARDPRDAAKVGAAWSGFLVVRWAMAMGIALLALTGIGDVSDPEQVMPLVLREYLAPGLRGVVIAGLLAAFMSTFSSTVNSGASYLVRDIWQPLFPGETDERRLVYVSYVATILLVAIGLLIGWQVRTIGQIFNWIMVELGAAFVIPNVLRWYWWRINGWGYASGTLVGMAGAIAIPFLPATMPLYVSFPVLCGVSLLGTLAGTWLTRPTDEATLAAFYRHVRPFGVWGPVRKTIAPPDAEEDDDVSSESLLSAAVNVLLGGVAILGAYLAPMYLVGHWHSAAGACLAVAIVAIAVLYFTWYRRLPPAEDRETEAGGASL